MNEAAQSILFKAAYERNGRNVCNCSYVRAYPHAILECCLVQKKFTSVMMIRDPQCRKWVSGSYFPPERMTLRIQRPKHRDCLLEKRGKEMASVEKQKIDDLGEIFQCRAAARGTWPPGRSPSARLCWLWERREGVPAARHPWCAGQYSCNGERQKEQRHRAVEWMKVAWSYFLTSLPASVFCINQPLGFPCSYLLHFNH